MTIKEFYTKFLDSGIGTDVYKTKIEFLVTESFFENEDTKRYMYFNYTLGLIHHGIKYEITQINKINCATSENETDYYLNEVESFSKYKEKEGVQRKYFLCKRELIPAEDKAHEIAKMIQYEKIEETDVYVEDEDLIFDGLIILPKERRYAHLSLSGLFFSYDETVEIKEEEYLTSFTK